MAKLFKYLFSLSIVLIVITAASINSGDTTEKVYAPILDLKFEVVHLGTLKPEGFDNDVGYKPAGFEVNRVNTSIVYQAANYTEPVVGNYARMYRRARDGLTC